MRLVRWISLFGVCLLGNMTACRKQPLEWNSVAAKHSQWHYLIARDAQVLPRARDAQIRDDELLLTDAVVVPYESLNRPTNGVFTLAMPATFQTMLVTGAVACAALPEFKGKVLPTVVDRKIEVHFLSRTNATWFSTNLLRTRVISTTCSP